MDIEKNAARSRDGRGEHGWPWTSAIPVAGETVPLDDEPLRGRLANTVPHPYFLNRHRVLMNELAQSEREFDAAGYPELAAAATAAREAVQDLYRATRAVEEDEDRCARAAE